MRLFLSYTSPFARKARMALMEKGLLRQVELVEVNAWENPPELVKHNPLSQVPVLLLDDGEALFDSAVICAYLDELHPAPPLLPSGALERARILRMQALADGVTDAAVRVRMMRLEAKGAPDNAQTKRQYDKIIAGVGAMQDELAHLRDAVNLGAISFGATLGYLDFRFPQMGWRDKAPELAAWYEDFAARPCMQATELAE